MRRSQLSMILYWIVCWQYTHYAHSETIHFDNRVKRYQRDSVSRRWQVISKVTPLNPREFMRTSWRKYPPTGRREKYTQERKHIINIFIFIFIFYLLSSTIENLHSISCYLRSYVILGDDFSSQPSSRQPSSHVFLWDSDPFRPRVIAIRRYGNLASL